MPIDITKRLYEAGSVGADGSPGDNLCLLAFYEIIKLRNELSLCIHEGSNGENCNITDEACKLCIAGPD